MSITSLHFVQAGAGEKRRGSRALDCPARAGTSAAGLQTPFESFAKGL